MGSLSLLKVADSLPYSSHQGDNGDLCGCPKDEQFTLLSLLWLDITSSSRVKVADSFLAVPIKEIKEVRVGKNTDVLRNKDVAGHYPDECAFSIIYSDNFETMDLIANTPDEVNIWVTGLTCLISGKNSEYMCTHLDLFKKGRPRRSRDGILESCLRRRCARHSPGGPRAWRVSPEGRVNPESDVTCWLEALGLHAESAHTSCTCCPEGMFLQLLQRYLRVTSCFQLFLCYDQVLSIIFKCGCIWPSWAGMVFIIAQSSVQPRCQEKTKML